MHLTHNIKETKVRHMFTKCSVSGCGCQVIAYICFHKNGKVYWNGKCAKHNVSNNEQFTDWDEMPYDKLQDFLFSLV